MLIKNKVNVSVGRWWSNWIIYEEFAFAARISSANENLMNGRVKEIVFKGSYEVRIELPIVRKFALVIESFLNKTIGSFDLQMIIKITNKKEEEIDKN